MRKKRVMVMVGIVAVCVICALLFALRKQQEEPTAREQADEMLGRIENALDEMDQDWEKYSVTETTPLTYEDEAGNTIIYYLCTTTYYGADPSEVTGLNLQAVQCVFEPETAGSSRSCSVNDLEAMLYEVGERSYLCWTISPVYTCILEYSPGAVTEADIFKMAESVPADVAE